MKIVDLSNSSDFSVACSELFDAIETEGGEGPLYVGIETGGLRIVEDWASKYPIEWCSVKTQRPTTRYKGLIKPLLMVLPVWLTDMLRNIERILLRQTAQWGSAESDSHPGREVTASAQAREKIAAASTIVMVDDAIDSGATIKATRRFLAEMNASAILKVAALTYTEPDIAPAPDYLLYRGQLVRFPWSNDRKR